MNETLVLVLLPVIVVVVVLAVAFAIRGRVQRRLYAGTGLEEWRTAAAELPWRDRWILSRANSRGRAAPLRLAALAVQRGEVMIAIAERNTREKSGIRRMWWVFAVVWLIISAGNVSMLVVGSREWFTWVQAIVGLGLAIGFGFMVRIQRRQVRQIQRSVALNRQQMPTGR